MARIRFVVAMSCLVALLFNSVHPANAYGLRRWYVFNQRTAYGAYAEIYTPSSAALLTQLSAPISNAEWNYFQSHSVSTATIGDKWVQTGWSFTNTATIAYSYVEVSAGPNTRQKLQQASQSWNTSKQYQVLWISNQRWCAYINNFTDLFA